MQFLTFIKCAVRRRTHSSVRILAIVTDDRTISNAMLTRVASERTEWEAKTNNAFLCAVKWCLLRYVLFYAEFFFIVFIISISLVLWTHNSLCACEAHRTSFPLGLLCISNGRPAARDCVSARASSDSTGGMMQPPELFKSLAYTSFLKKCLLYCPLVYSIDAIHFASIYMVISWLLTIHHHCINHTLHIGMHLKIFLGVCLFAYRMHYNEKEKRMLTLRPYTFRASAAVWMASSVRYVCFLSIPIEYLTRSRISRMFRW